MEIRITEGEAGLFWFQDGKRKDPGTKITLYLKNNHPFKNIIKDKYELVSCESLKRKIGDIAPHVEIPIIVKRESEKAWDWKKEKWEKASNPVSEEIVTDRFSYYEPAPDLSITERVNRISSIFEQFKRGLITSQELSEHLTALLPHHPIQVPAEIIIGLKGPLIEFVRLDLNEPDGLRGVMVCMLLKTSYPTEIYTNRVVFAENYLGSNDKGFEFQPRLSLRDNAIAYYESKYAETNDAAIDRSSSFGLLSINGFDVPDYIFYDKSMGKFAYDDMLRWPFPVYYFDLDLSGEWELNLTVSRDEIILDDKFNLFKERFAEVIAHALVKTVDDKIKVDGLLKALNIVADELYLNEKFKHILIALQTAAAKMI